jgi:hypothetical protein
MCGPVEDALLESPLAARIDVLGRERFLSLGNLADRLVEITLLRLAPVEDAGFIEMDVGLDEARGDEAPLDVELSPLSSEVRLKRDDPPTVDTNVRRACAGRLGDACIPKDEIHGLLPCVWRAYRRRTEIHRPTRP